MVTVGYGDYVPLSCYGRSFSLVISIIGIWHNCMVTLVLLEKLSPEYHEKVFLRRFESEHRKTESFDQMSRMIRYFRILKIYVCLRPTPLGQILTQVHLRHLFALKRQMHRLRFEEELEDLRDEKRTIRDLKAIQDKLAVVNSTKDYEREMLNEVEELIYSESE